MSSSVTWLRGEADRRVGGGRLAIICRPFVEFEWAECVFVELDRVSDVLLLPALYKKDGKY